MERGVLFISPHSEDAANISRMLDGVHVPVVYAPNLGQARGRLQHDRFGVILTEAKLPDGSWEDVMDLNRQLETPSEIIVTDPFADSRFWAEALSRGAYDLLAQPFHVAEVQRIVANACSRPSRAYAASGTVV